MDQNTIATAAASASQPSGSTERGIHARIDIESIEHGDSVQFRNLLEQYMGSGGQAGGQQGGRKGEDANSLGNVIADKTAGLAGEIKKDQLYVSKMLEQATRTGDSLHLMRAMMALNDYQLRVQAISKTVAKASTSIDSLTKLQ